MGEGDKGPKKPEEKKTGIVVPMRRDKLERREMPLLGRSGETVQETRIRLRLGTKSMERVAGFHVGCEFIDPPTSAQTDIFFKLVGDTLRVLNESDPGLEQTAKAKIGIRLARDSGELIVWAGLWEEEGWKEGPERVQLRDDAETINYLVRLVQKYSSRQG